MNFNDLELNESILDGLRDVGFSTPTKIQIESITPILAGRDIVASSETGTGKTGAFVIPVLQQLLKNPSAGVKCLILTPTRELANQIDEQVTVIGYYSGITSATVFGGTDGGEFGIQERALRSGGANIIIATPGRLLDHIKMNYVDFSKVEFLILDEADRMLDMGFLPDVKRIIAQLPETRQNILFSATIPDSLKIFFQSITNDPVRVDCSVARTASGIAQYYYWVSEENREQVLITLLKDETVSSAIVFTRTKREADQLFRKLTKAGISAGSVHGDREQAEREQTLDFFKSGKIRVLVATDVLARGIDVDDVSHVFNYEVPHDAEDYIHRIGRTARAEAKGVAITLVSRKESRAFLRIKKQVGSPIEELLLDGFDIDAIGEAQIHQEKRSGKKTQSEQVKHQKIESHSTPTHQNDVIGTDGSFIRTSTTKKTGEIVEKTVETPEKSQKLRKAPLKKVKEIDLPVSEITHRKTKLRHKLIKQSEREQQTPEMKKEIGFLGKLKRFFGIGA